MILAVCVPKPGVHFVCFIVHYWQIWRNCVLFCFVLWRKRPNVGFCAKLSEVRTYSKTQDSWDLRAHRLVTLPASWQPTTYEYVCHTITWRTHDVAIFKKTFFQKTKTKSLESAGKRTTNTRTHEQFSEIGMKSVEETPNPQNYSCVCILCTYDGAMSATTRFLPTSYKQQAVRVEGWFCPILLLLLLLLRILVAFCSALLHKCICVFHQ